MRVLLQRVKRASCTVGNTTTGAIQKGFCAFVGFDEEDTREICDKMAAKIIKLRVFEDAQNKMNLSIQDVEGSVLSISQFTLYANCKKGNRPSFIDAAKPDKAIELYDYFNSILSAEVKVEKGVFGANMLIDLVNDGPVTIMLDDKELFGTC